MTDHQPRPTAAQAVVDADTNGKILKQQLIETFRHALERKEDQG